jgi:hypothetical protein
MPTAVKMEAETAAKMVPALEKWIWTVSLDHVSGSSEPSGKAEVILTVYSTT